MRLPRVNQRERVTGSASRRRPRLFLGSPARAAAARFSFRSRASSSRSAVVSPVRPVRAIGARALHPLAQRRLGQIEIAGDGADALALVEHQPDRLGFEVVIELPARPSLRGLCHRSGHRIRLSEDVHETGSSPARDDVPMCALPPEDWVAKWGSGASARGKKVAVTYLGTTVIGELRNTMPHKAAIKNGAGIDLNPGFAKTFNLRPPFLIAGVKWEWAQ